MAKPGTFAVVIVNVVLVVVMSFVVLRLLSLKRFRSLPNALFVAFLGAQSLFCLPSALYLFTGFDHSKFSSVGISGTSIAALCKAQSK